MHICAMQKMRRIRLRYSESEYFKVICPTSKQQRVGSGLSVKYLIRFSPDIKKVTDLSVYTNFDDIFCWFVNLFVCLIRALSSTTKGIENQKTV